MKTFKFLHLVLIIGTDGLCLVNVKKQKIVFKVSY